MRLKYKFIIQNVAGKPVAVAVGQDSSQFNGMIKLNDSGVVIFRLLMEEDLTEEEICSRIATHYGAAVEQIQPAALAFIQQLRQGNLLKE